MAMNQARVGLLVAAVLVAMPATALAQPKGPAKAAAGKKDAVKKGAAKEVNLDEAAATDKPPDKPAEPEAPAAGGDEGGGLGDICKIDPGACPTIDLDKAAARAT